MKNHIHKAKWYQERFNKGLQLTEDNGELSWLGEWKKQND